MTVWASQVAGHGIPTLQEEMSPIARRFGLRRWRNSAAECLAKGVEEGRVGECGIPCLESSEPVDIGPFGEQGPEAACGGTWIAGSGQCWRHAGAMMEARDPVAALALRVRVRI